MNKKESKTKLYTGFLYVNSVILNNINLQFSTNKNNINTQ